MYSERWDGALKREATGVSLYTRKEASVKQKYVIRNKKFNK